MRVSTVLLAITLCAAAPAMAQLKAAHFPADAKWVMHVDLKALNEAPMGQFLRQALDEEARRRLGALKASSGIDAEKDIDSLVVCGKGATQAGGLMYAYGRFDVQKLTAIAGGAKQFQNKALGERSLLSWSDKGKRTHLCFIDPTLIVMSQDEQLVQEAVGLIDGRAKGLSSGSSLARLLSHKPGRFVALQANNLAELAGANPQMQLFKQAEAAQLEIGQMAGANGLACSLALKAPNAETAQQLNQAAMGLQALALLQASQNPDAAELAQSVKVSQQETFVTVDLTLPETLIRKQLQARAEQRKAAQANRQAARAARPGAAAEKPERPAF
jgi:hypothetical protein